MQLLRFVCQWGLMLGLSLSVAVHAANETKPELTLIQTVNAPGTPATALPTLGTAAAPKDATALPTRWREEGATKWFVLPINLTSTQDQAIFIPRAGARVELWVNGQFAARFGQRGEAAFDQGKHPILHSFDPLHVKAGANELWLRIEGDITQTKGLSEMYVGDYTQAKLRYFQRWWREIGTAIAIVVACFVLGLFGLWFGLRIKTQYFVSFGLASFGWALQSMPTLFASSGLSHVILFILAEIGFGVFVSQIQIFAIQQMGIKNKWLLINAKFLFFVSLVIAPLAYAVSGQTGKILDAYHALLLASALLTMPFIVVRAFKKQTTAHWILLVASVTGIAFGTYDLLNIQLSNAGFSKFSITRFSALIFLLSMIAILLEKQIRSAQLEHHLNDELREKIAQREVELNVLHAEETKHHDNEIKRFEAERVAKQLQDGLSGKLSALQFLLQDPKFERSEGDKLVSEAMAQLQSNIETGISHSRDLASVVGYHLYNFKALFEQAGLAVDVQAGESPDGTLLSASQTTHLGFLLRGIFENVVKHAKATLLTVQVHHRPSPEVLQQLVIADNGVGFDMATVKQGMVIASFKRNANRLGARISLKSHVNGAGTRIALEWKV